jgi:uncharacterized protein (UPF0297 family)
VIILTNQNNESHSSPLSADHVLGEIYVALREKGYNPVMQIVGYLLTEDPTYITNYNHARALICRVDRDELLNEIVRFYFEQKKHENTPAEDTRA